MTVQCVEIYGAISRGETRKETLANIKEAIELVLEMQVAGLPKVANVAIERIAQKR